MTLKKTLSFLLALTLMLSVLAPCALPIKADAATESIHLVEELEYNTGKYYLYADVKTSSATSRQFYLTGYTTQTTPNSLLGIRTDYSTASAIQLIPNDETNPTAFQINPAANVGRIIVHYDVDSAVAGLDTTEKSSPAHDISMFTWEKGMICHTFNNESYVLVCQYLSSKWRMKFVPAAEAEKSGNFIVKIGELRECSNTYQADDSSHWLGCSCGTKNGDAVAHTYGTAANGSRTCTACGYVNTVYSNNAKYEKVNYPTVGDGYYLAANVEGTLYVFYNGTFSATTTASLTVHQSPSEPMALTLEAPAEKGMDGFQLTYPDPSQDRTLRIYSYNTKGADANGFTTTSVRTGSASRAQETFIIDEVNGVEVLRKAVSGNVLVVTEMDETNGLRLVCADPSKVGAEGVYPAMLVRAHTHSFTENAYTGDHTGHYQHCWCGEVSGEALAHTYGAWSFDSENGKQSRTCTACGYVETLYGTTTKVSQVAEPVVGGSYYLAANVNGKIYFFRYGSATETIPYSAPLTDSLSHTWLREVTLEAPVEGDTGFQMIFADPTQDRDLRIYCYDSKNDGENKGVMDTGWNVDNFINRHSFYLDELNGVTVLRKFGNLNVMAVKSFQDIGWRMLGVPAEEITAGTAYPAMLVQVHTHSFTENTYSGDHTGHYQHCWCGAVSEEALAHTYGAWSFDSENGTQSHICTACGYEDTLYGTTTKVSQVAEPVIGESYYLAANVAGVLKFFTTGTVTNTAPYSLVTTERIGIAQQIILESSTASTMAPNESVEGCFQFTYDNNGTLTRIYCMDVLKDATIAGQTGIMDTGLQSGAGYKGRHSFFADEVNGMKVLRKYSNNNILVVKYNETTKTYRMLGVPEAELANEGVYPVMLATAHTHSYDKTEYGYDSNGHGYPCDCGGFANYESHIFGEWTLDAAAQTQSATCSVCGYAHTTASPYFDTVDSEAELIQGLATMTRDEATSPIYAIDGNVYYLMTDIDGAPYYFRHASVTAAGNAESVLSTSTETVGNSLYATGDINHGSIPELRVTKGNTEDTYIITYAQDPGLAFYINDEGANGTIDVGLTQYKGYQWKDASGTYQARVEFKWDAANGCLYQEENGVKYVLAVKQLTATYTDANTKEVLETATEWRITAVPMNEATAENGAYALTLATHEHNLSISEEAQNEWYACGCGYKGLRWNVILSDNIGVNFVLTLAENDTLVVTVNGKEVPAVLTDNGNGTYKVFIELAAAQMADEIAISINGNVANRTYSVRGYADVILAGNYSDDIKELVKNMLAYGGAAQKYFDHNTEVWADEDIEVSVSMPANGPELEVLDELNGIQFYGASVVHDERTAVRFYFKAESVEGLTFMVNGNVYEPANKNNMFYIEVAGINPQDLADSLNVVVSDGTNSLAVQYSPLTYMVRMYHKANSSQNTKALVQAMYGYYSAARTYTANMILGNGFAVKSQSENELYEGVSLYEKVYAAAGYGEVEAYILAVNSDANVELKVSAGVWDESNNGSDPAEAKTVANHFRAVKNAGYNVLAMINGGFFDLNDTKSYLPYGMQVVDGVVKQAPSTSNSYSDNWFGMTKEGKYVISNAAGYESTYAGNVQQAVGGGKLLMINGEPVEDLTTDRAYRTAVGVNAKGDLVMVAVADATYSDVCRIFVDMGMDIITVLNLDGGGSTAMYVPGTYYPKALILGDDGWFPREVADAIAIVEKK